MSLERAKPRVTGSRIATIAVLFIHALKNAATQANERIAQRVLPESRSRRTLPDVIDRARVFQRAADDKQRGNGQRRLVFENLGHLPRIHQAKRHHQAQNRQREHVRRGPLADERNQRQGDDQQREEDLKSHGGSGPCCRVARTPMNRPPRFGKPGMNKPPESQI